MVLKKFLIRLTEISNDEKLGTLCESLTTAVNAVIDAIFDNANAIKLAAKWADEKLDCFIVLFITVVDNVAITPNEPAINALVPAHNPAPELPNDAPWINTNTPNTTNTTPVNKK